MKLANKPHSRAKELLGLNADNKILMTATEFSFGISGAGTLMKFAQCDKVVLVDTDGKHILIKGNWNERKA